MADSDKKGISTGAAVAIGVGALVAGVVGTAVVYEVMVIPNALESKGGQKATTGIAVFK